MSTGQDARVVSDNSLAKPMLWIYFDLGIMEICDDTRTKLQTGDIQIGDEFAHKYCVLWLNENMRSQLLNLPSICCESSSSGLNCSMSRLLHFDDYMRYFSRVIY